MSRADQPGRTLEPFVWHADGTERFPHILALDEIRSLASGAAVVLELLEADSLNEDDEACFGSVLNGNQKGALLRLAIVTNKLISDRCDRAFDWTAEHGMNRVSDLARGAK
jgi:hypothetical protein